MKKIVSVILVLMMVIPGFCVFAYAEDGGSFLLVPSTLAAKPGDTVTFTVTGQGFSEKANAIGVKLVSVDEGLTVSNEQWLVTGEIRSGFDGDGTALFSDETPVALADVFSFDVAISDNAENKVYRIKLMFAVNGSSRIYETIGDISVTDTVATTTANVLYATKGNEKNNKITFTVSLSNAKSVSVIAVTPVYDSTVFELVETQWLVSKSSTDCCDFDVDAGDGIWFSGVGGRSIDPNGDVFSFTLWALTDASDGTYNVSCEVRLADENDAIGAACHMKEATVNVMGALRGDFNGDGSVDSQDAIWLLNAFYNEKMIPNQSEDVNGDGEFDSRDAIYLLNYFYDQTAFPLY